MKFWTITQRFPPLLCRILARKPCHTGASNHPVPLSDEEIITASGLTPWKVQEISFSLSWDSFAVVEMRRFTLGCGINFDNATQMKRLWQYMNNRKIKRFSYLKKSKEWAALKPLIAKWREAIKQKDKS